MEGVSLLYQLLFASIAATIVSGAAAKRVRHGAYLVFAAAMPLLIDLVLSHWA
jgi:ammonium transporter, Amt family